MAVSYILTDIVVWIILKTIKYTQIESNILLPLSLLPSTQTAGHPHSERGRGGEKNQGEPAHVQANYNLHTHQRAEELSENTLTQRYSRTEGLMAASDKCFPSCHLREKWTWSREEDLCGREEDSVGRGDCCCLCLGFTHSYFILPVSVGVISRGMVYFSFYFSNLFIQMVTLETC